MKMKLRKTLIALVTIILTMCIAMPVYAATPKLSNTTVYLKVGQTKTISLKNISPDNKVTFKSSDSAIASVSKRGKITAKKAGTTTITLKYRYKKYKCKVYVNKNCLFR